MHWALLLLFICLGIACLFSDLPLTKSLRAWYCKLSQGFCYFITVKIWVKPKIIKPLAWTFIASIALLALDGLFQRIFGFDFLRQFPLLVTNDVVAVTGPFPHYNAFAGFIAPLFFIVFGFMFAFPRWRKWLAVLLICLLLNLVFAYSRAAWLGLMVAALLVPGIFGTVSMKRLIWPLMGLLLVGILIVPEARERLFFILTRRGEEERWLIWHAAWLMFMDSPFVGLGPGSFMGALPQYAAQVGLEAAASHQYAHNSYLQILVEGGIFSFIPLFAFFVLFLKMGFKQVKKQDPIFIGFFAASIVLITHAFFESHFYSTRLLVLFWMTLSFSHLWTQWKNHAE